MPSSSMWLQSERNGSLSTKCRGDHSAPPRPWRTAFGHRTADLALHRVVLDHRRRVERGTDHHRREALLRDPVELASREQDEWSGRIATGCTRPLVCAAKSQIQSL